MLKKGQFKAAKTTHRLNTPLAARLTPYIDVADTSTTI